MDPSCYAISMSDVTRILLQIEHGDSSSSEQLLPLVYEELRKLASARLANEQPEHTLQATALVHEAYVRLVDVDRAQHWNSRGHSLVLQPKRCGESWWKELDNAKASRQVVIFNG